jgi:DNA-directed RNA polymerase specialized sigma24 family protein
MTHRNETDMGGVREAFLTTHWSLIEEIQASEDKDKALIGLLLEQYWKPVYCYLRRKGYDNEPAEDLTQDFFHEVVLHRHLVERADPSKGRFRTFLLHALNQYVLDEQRKDAAHKRIPPTKVVSLDMTNPPSLPPTMQEAGPDECFNYAWKADLLDRVLSELKQWYTTQGMETHWRLFRDRLVEPNLDSQETPSLSELCRRYGIENETKASNMLGTVKRQFRTILDKHVRQTVVSGEAAEEELSEIFEFLER